MERRQFLQLAAASPLFTQAGVLPDYKIVTRHRRPEGASGMPGMYPGKAVRVRSEEAVDTAANCVRGQAVRRMLTAGMQELTGTTNPRDAWAQFFSPQDVIGIKVNCSGAPEIHSNPEVVVAIIENLQSIGI
ncbi:MAG: hypothetical protein JO182_05985, partial [Acidobacteriaceae bacterium]|nr:hypothetical protein [Acidobacteriaceae bacterium]